MAAIPLLENIDWFLWIGSFAKWFAYGIILFTVTASAYALYYLGNFKFRATVFPLVGSGTTTGLSVGKQTKNRFKWNKKKTAWIALKPLFNKHEIEPFEDKYIYSGKRLYTFKLGEHYLPGCINISKDETDKLITEINPVPHSIRNWQALELQKNEIEFAKSGWWEQNKYVFMLLATAGICLFMVGLTVYFTYQFAAGGRADISALTSALTSFGGGPPAG